MRCYCCGRAVPLARKARLRAVRNLPPEMGGPDSAAYLSYAEETTYRWAVLCPGCYAVLDNPSGVAAIGGGTFGIAGASRGGKAAVVDAAKYAAFRRREAAKLGFDLGDED